jgi:endonuclease YncB( thermonuclease family)
MQILPRALAVGVAIFQLAAPTARVTRSESVVVRAVFDGDTIDVATYGRVRLLGIDAPEIGRGYDTPAPFGREARDRLAALVLHRWVRLEQEGQRRDAYNRHLAYVVREDGVFVNAAMVREGLARVSARVPLTRLDELKRAEAEAQSFRRGMWGASPRIPPTSYTSRSRRKY